MRDFVETYEFIKPKRRDYEDFYEEEIDDEEPEKDI